MHKPRSAAWMLAARHLQPCLQALVGMPNQHAGLFSVDRTVWAPRCNSEEVIGLVTPPAGAKAFVEFSRAMIRPKRIAAMLAS